MLIFYQKFDKQIPKACKGEKGHLKSILKDPSLFFPNYKYTKSSLFYSI